MFIYSLEKKSLINTAHIVSVYIDAPQYEAKDWRVYCSTRMGSHLLYRGTEKGCADFLEAFRITTEINP